MTTDSPCVLTVGLPTPVELAGTIARLKPAEVHTPRTYVIAKLDSAVVPHTSRTQEVKPGKKPGSSQIHPARADVSQ